MSARKSLLFSVLDRHAALLVDVVSSMVLARLLMPAEIGLFSVTVTLLGFVAAFRDLGTGQYVIQERELTPERLQSAWGVQLLAGAVLAALAAAAAVPLAGFFDETRVRDIVLIVAASYLLSPVGSITYALLMREMRYDAVAVIRVSGSVAGAATSIGLAWQGLGAASLAWGGLATTIVTALASLAYRSGRVSWRPRLVEARRVLGIGGRVIAMSMLDTLGRGLPEFVLGKLQGFGAAGYFSRASGLVRMFDRLVTDAVYPVGLSVLARRAREGGDVREDFVRALACMSALAWPFAIVLALLADPLVRLLYGPQWDAAVPVLRLLAPAMALSVPLALSHILLVALGDVGRALRAAAWSLAATALAVALGAPQGMQALAAALVAASAVASAVWLAQARAAVPFELWSILRAALPDPRLCTVVALPPLAALALWGWVPAHPLPPLLWSAALTPPCWAAVLVLTGHPLGAELRRAWGRLRERRPV